MAGRPSRSLRGGVKAGKAGEWAVLPNGSGTWTRRDRNASRFSTLWSSGPARQECHTRVTYDANIGEVLQTLKGFDVAKDINAKLPEPTPRDIRSVFHLNATTKKVPKVACQDSFAAVAWKPTLFRGEPAAS